MTGLKRLFPILPILLCLLVGCSQKNRDENIKVEKEITSATAFESEEQVMDQLNVLKQAEKTEEALDLLSRAQKQFPKSFTILGEKFMILRGEGRHKECLDLINDNFGQFTEAERERMLRGKLAVLLPLIKSELEEGQGEQPFTHFKEIAEAGYRGFHNLRHDELYAPLRRREEFTDVMDRIAQNTGIGSRPKDFTVTLTDGDAFTLSEQKGTVIMVDFWSTSCPPCIEELPNLRKIYAENKDKGFEIISISLDDDAEKLNAFLTENPMPWKRVFSGRAWSDDVARSYQIDWIPSIWLVDKAGTLRYFDVRGDDLKTAIEELVAE